MLGLPSASLAFALSHYCGFAADKAQQLADWRVRPLPPAMLAYARADTHFLLYIHDRCGPAVVFGEGFGGGVWKGLCGGFGGFCEVIGKGLGFERGAGG